MWMSVWPAHAARSVPTCTVPTSATADRATTSGRMGTPVKVRHALFNLTNTIFIPNLCSDKFMNQSHIIYFIVVVQTSMSVPRASAICAPTSVWTFLAVTSALVLNTDTPCLQMDALAEVNPLPLNKHRTNRMHMLTASSLRVRLTEFCSELAFRNASAPI